MAEGIRSARQISVTVCTSSPEDNIQALLTYLKDITRERCGLVKNVSYYKLPYNGLDKHKFTNEDHIDVMILCHSIQNRRFAITDVPDALYDTFLLHCQKSIGKAKIAVIVHDVEDLSTEKYSHRMSNFHHAQPTLFSIASLVMMHGSLCEGEELTKTFMDLIINFLKKASQQPVEFENVNEDDLVEESELSKLTRNFPHKKFHDLSRELGTVYNEANSILASCSNDYITALMEVLMRWKDRTGGPRNELVKALHLVDAGGLVPIIAGLLQRTPPLQQKVECTYESATTNFPGSTSQHSVPESSRIVDTSASRSSSNMTQSNPRPISVSICSSAYQHNVSGLVSWFNDLKTKQSHIIADVRFRELPYNDIDSFKFKPQDSVDVMVLCHSVDNRGFSITDVVHSIYDKYLKYCHNLIGKRKLAVIVHDFKDMDQETIKVKMESFRRLQPSTFKLVDTVILCGSLEIPGKIQMGDKEETQLVIFLEKARFEQRENLTINSQSFADEVIGFLSNS